MKKSAFYKVTSQNGLLSWSSRFVLVSLIENAFSLTGPNDLFSDRLTAQPADGPKGSVPVIVSPERTAIFVSNRLFLSSGNTPFLGVQS